MSSGLRDDDRIIAHVTTPDARHVQVALYGASAIVEPGETSATWNGARLADTGEPLTPREEELHHDALVAAVLTRFAP